MLAKIIVILSLISILIMFLYKKNFYRSVKRGNVGPVLYFAKPVSSFSSCLFCFRYKYSEGSWYAYIEKMPACFNFPVRKGATPYIFFIQPIKNFDEIKRKSFYWADTMQASIASVKRG